MALTHLGNGIPVEDFMLSTIDRPEGMLNLVAPAWKRARNTVQDYAPLLRADVIEGVEDFHVYVDLPGVDPSDLDVNISNNYLHLKAERKQLFEQDDGFTHRIERSYGKVTRSLLIPFGVNSDAAEASFSNGVLKVRLPKSESITGRKKLMINVM